MPETLPNLPRSWFAIAETGNRRASIAIDGPIGWYGVTAADFRAALDELGAVDEIEVVVNSPGGAVGDGVAIYNMLRKHKAHVTTSIEGYALSMGSVIAMAGDTVKMASTGIFMIHDPWTIAMGSATEMRKEADVLDTHKGALVKAYSMRAGVDADAVSSLMTDETWMDSDKALELGFVDSVYDAPEDDDDEQDDETKALGLSGDEISAFLERLGGNAPSWASSRINTFTTARAARAVPQGNTETPMPTPMTDGAAQGANQATAGAEPVVAVSTAPDAAALESAAAQGATAERARVAGIRAAFTAAGLPESFAAARDTAEADGSTVAEFNKIVAVLTSCKDAEPAGRDATAYAGEDHRDKFRAGATAALSAAAGLGNYDPQNEFNSMSLIEIARASVTAGSARPTGNRMEVVAAAFTHSTSDFPNILHDVAHRSLLAGFDEVEETFEQWTGSGNFRDFRDHDRVGWNGFENLETIKEGGEYKRDTFDDYMETAKLDTVGKMFGITRQAIINDDIGVFSQIPRMFGDAARRTIGAKVVDILITNPKLSDGLAMFHATHGNLNTTTADINTGSVGAIRSAMALNKGRRTQADAQPSGIRPNILLVPLALEDRARVLAESEGHIKAGALDANMARTPNAVRNTFTVVADPRLDAVSTVDWYMLSTRRPAIEVGYLDGNKAPYLEAKNGWDIDGVEWKVRLDVGCNAVEFMTIYKQAGE